MRDEFTENTKRILAARTGQHCSNPQCRHPTVGPGSEKDTIVNIGVAAHITAASPGTPEKPAPRYDKTLTKEQRRDISNGILLCQNCAKLIDSDVSQFTVSVLQKWRQEAEERAFLALAKPEGPSNRLAVLFEELDEDDVDFLQNLRLSENDDAESVTERMRQAAQTDIAAFRATRAWPHHVIELNLSLDVNDNKNAVSLGGIANATGVFSTLSMVSPPGTGKSTTLVQLAGKMVDGGFAIPILLPLGEWAGTGEDFFAFFGRRNAFRNFRHQHFQQMAFYGRLVLLIDGWNEVDATTRVQAMRQLGALRRDFPLLSIVIGTRRQAVVSPGEIVEIELLAEDQQLAIARTFPGGSKEAVLDRAWRTPGIRELISIPLYLNALLDSTQDGSFPQTKEEVLSAFVARHEASPDKAEILRTELLGCHKDMLIGLAVEANRLDIATISDESARLAVSQVGTRLASNGQITVPPQPSVVLDILVDTHALVRSTTETGGLAFQHQQFQEWYASFEVERLMLANSRGDTEAKRVLLTQILNWLTWEESILFACERLSRKDAAGAHSVGQTIIEALGIDPMLAAELIYRSSPAVWTQIKDRVILFARCWHKTGEVDRGARFMMTSGCSEFADQIWPLVANLDNQVYLNALRKPNRFRPSVLGPDAVKRLTELPDTIRGDIVAAIVHESGFDGLELGAEIAKKDSNAEAVVKIIQALEFRRADRHISEVLQNCSELVLEKLASIGFPFPPMNPMVKNYIAAIRTLQNPKDNDPIRCILQLVNRVPPSDAFGAEISKIIESEQFPVKNSLAPHALKRAMENYPTHTREALLNRIQAGLPVPHGTKEFLQDISVVDDGPLAAAALDKATPDATARFAFTIIGPETVGRLLDELFIVHDEVQAKGQQLDEATRKEYWRLMDAVAGTRQMSFIEALQNRAKSDEPHRIQLMAELLSRHGKGENNMLSLSGNALDSLAGIIDKWINILLTSPIANRHQMAHVVQAIERLPKPRFVDGMHKMLERDLADRAQAQEDFKKSRPAGPIPPDVTMDWTLQYQRAFAAIGGAEVVALMKGYLPDLRFGIKAAIVLSAVWNKDNGPTKERRFGTWHDFSDVKANRMSRQDKKNPPASSDFAEAIFAVARGLRTERADNATQRHVIQLATVGLRMPHGSKRSDFEALMALPLPFAAKRELLAAAVEAGEVIKADDLAAGIDQLLETAKKETWRLDKNTGELMGWIELFPFSDRPTAVVEVLDKIPEPHRQPWDLDRLLIAVADSPPDDALQVLRILADRDKRILDQHYWTAAVFNLGTEAAAGLIIERICDGSLPGRNGFSEKRLAELAKQHPKIRAELLQRYTNLQRGKPHSLLESVLREIADAEIVLTFVQDYARHKRSFDGNLANSIRKTAVGKRPVANWPNAYNQFSVPLTALRKTLLKMSFANTAESVMAEVCLNEIEELRDEHGRINDEPRHPDIDSGQVWPKDASRAKD